MNQSLRRKLDRVTDILWTGGVTNPVPYRNRLPTSSTSSCRMEKKPIAN